MISVSEAIGVRVIWDDSVAHRIGTRPHDSRCTFVRYSPRVRQIMEQLVLVRSTVSCAMNSIFRTDDSCTTSALYGISSTWAYYLESL